MASELDKMLDEIVRRAEKRSPYDPTPNKDVSQLVAALKYVYGCNSGDRRGWHYREIRAKLLSILKGNPDAVKD